MENVFFDDSISDEIFKTYDEINKNFDTPALKCESENEKLWTLQAGIFPENIASLKIHEALGFRKIGHRERIGQMNGIWRDIILLERRSKLIGIGQ